MIIRPAARPVASPLARAIAEGSGLPWESGDGAGLLSLYLGSGGTFTRGSEGSYLIGAPTDGSSAFLAWAGNDVRRIENRRDGLGWMLLMEGSRTNLVIQSRDCTDANWTTYGTCTRTADQAPGPDGSNVADRGQVASTGVIYQQRNTLTAAAIHAGSSYLRARSGTSPSGFNFYDGGTLHEVNPTLTTSWQRVDVEMTPTGTSGYLQPWCGANPNQALDYYGDLHQIERGAFPSSAIRTTTVAVTRAADVLSYSAGLFPDRIWSAGFTVVVAPDFSSADQVAGAPDAYVLSVGAGGNNSLILERNGGTPRLALYSGGVLKASVACTWSRAQKLTIGVNLATGALTLSGFTTGNGTTTGSAAPWSSGTLYVGGASGGTLPFFGRFGLTVVPA